ncbi:hypothetical protein CERSUDRAFT_69820 [Gelatoporia subvermispora B]|uniref:Hydrophobin n=1 Tax=Ceriporiopsis subvermispora (strain B) TaxID=914234 RepID=M2PWK7_CERS8|nr:hypothetical protein CERSUDRAFT_69820 [Gelatoporia subvermispora B]
MEACKLLVHRARTYSHLFARIALVLALTGEFTAFTALFATLAAATPLAFASFDACCSSVGQASDPSIAKELGLFGVVIQDVTASVGVECSPITVVGVGSGSACSGTTVSCESSEHGGLVQVGSPPSRSEDPHRSARCLPAARVKMCASEQWRHLYKYFRYVVGHLQEMSIGKNATYRMPFRCSPMVALYFKAGAGILSIVGTQIGFRGRLGSHTQEIIGGRRRQYIEGGNVVELGGQEGTAADSMSTNCNVGHKRVLVFRINRASTA